MLIRTILPSLIGLSPSSDFWMAFSIAGITLESQGEIWIMRLSGTDRDATWLSGVGTP